MSVSLSRSPAVAEAVSLSGARVPPTPQELLDEARTLLDARCPRSAAMTIRLAVELWAKGFSQGKKPTPVLVGRAITAGMVSQAQGKLASRLWKAGCAAAHGAPMGTTRVRIMLGQAERLFAGDANGEEVQP